MSRAVRSRDLGVRSDHAGTVVAPVGGEWANQAVRSELRPSDHLEFEVPGLAAPARVRRLRSSGRLIPFLIALAMDARQVIVDP
jgi:hypothetical protein